MGRVRAGLRRAGRSVVGFARRYRRLFAVVMLILLAIGLAYLAYWALRFLPDRIVAESSTPEELARLREVNAARRTVAQIIGGIVVLLGALVTAWLTIRRVRVAEQQVKLETQGDITDRLSRGIEQLGAKSGAEPTPEIRAGAVFTLERVAVESESSFGSVFQILMGYLRAHSPRLEGDAGTPPLREQLRMDVGAAFLAFERLVPTSSPRTDISADLRVVLPRIHYPSANLGGANLSRANLSGANLTRADLSGADVTRADLFGADLSGADLRGANLIGADLFGADLSGANLTRAYLTRAYLTRAYLIEADLSEAYLIEANLIGADLSGAALRGANLGGADLSGANLIGADLSDVLYDATTLWPESFDPPASR